MLVKTVGHHAAPSVVQGGFGAPHVVPLGAQTHAAVHLWMGNDVSYHVKLFMYLKWF